MAGFTWPALTSCASWRAPSSGSVCAASTVGPSLAVLYAYQNRPSGLVPAVVPGPGVAYCQVAALRSQLNSVGPAITCLGPAHSSGAFNAADLPSMLSLKVPPDRSQRMIWLPLPV